MFQQQRKHFDCSLTWLTYLINIPLKKTDKVLVMVFFNHLLMLLLIDIFCYTLCKIGECHDYDSNDWFCCDNFEMRENICVECQLGYTSFSRKSCVPCRNKTYGKRCAGICSCIATQRCDHVKGCILNTSPPVTNTTDTFEEDTSIQSSINTTNFRKRNVSTIKPSLKTTENRELNGSNQHIMIYIVCAGVLFLLFVMSAVCILKKETAVDIILRNTKKTSETEKGIILKFKNGEHLENCASTYDIIDEHYVFSNVLQSV